MSRSCAIACREPCQSLIAAALNGLFYVPQGCFDGAIGRYTGSVFRVGMGVLFSFVKNAVFTAFFAVFFLALH